MPDYNIYIHSAITSNATSPTKPWVSQTGENAPWGSSDSLTSQITKSVSKTAGVLMNPDSIISTGTSALIKAIPWIAIAIIVAKAVDKLVSTSINYNSLESGDYRDSIAWANFKSNFSWIFKPFSTGWNEMQTQNKYRIENYRQTMKRELLGDSIINSYTNRGV